MGKFKDLKRRGWILRNVSYPESDAEHSFSVALLTLILAPQGIDKFKCLKMALIHDLAEIYAGDYTPDDKILPQQKFLREKNAAIILANELGWPELVELFEEYEKMETKESLFVKALDKLDNVVSAKYYDINNRSDVKLVNEFAKHAEGCINNIKISEIEQVKSILNYIADKGVQ